MDGKTELPTEATRANASYLPYDPTISLIYIYSRNMKIHAHKNICALMFTIDLFKIDTNRI